MKKSGKGAIESFYIYGLMLICSSLLFSCNFFGEEIGGKASRYLKVSADLPDSAYIQISTQFVTESTSKLCMDNDWPANPGWHQGERRPSTAIRPHDKPKLIPASNMSSFFCDYDLQYVVIRVHANGYLPTIDIFPYKKNNDIKIIPDSISVTCTYAGKDPYYNEDFYKCDLDDTTNYTLMLPESRDTISVHFTVKNIN